MGAQLSQSGTTAIPSGSSTYHVTGLGLDFTPTGVSVNLRKPTVDAYNIAATPIGALTADGFTVELSAATEETGYQLDWILWATSTAIDTTGTLQVSYSDLCDTVSRFLGYDPDNLTDAQEDEVDAYVQSGVRNFYFPPAVNGAEVGYEWSFMRPATTLTTVEDVGIAALPANLARIVGDIYFESTVYEPSAVQTSEHRVLSLLQSEPSTGAPRCFAVRFKQAYGTHGQVQEIVFWPTPDAAYTLAYRYEAYSGKLTDLNPCPLGGARFSELVTESCLAVAEQRANDERGLHTERFMQLLVAGVEMDRRNSARYYGNMGGMPEGGASLCGRIRPGVLYNGTAI